MPRWVPGFEGACPWKAGQSVRRVHLPLDPLPIFCTSALEPSASASTIYLQITLGRQKADGLYTGLLSTSEEWEYALSGKTLVRWKIGVLRSILVDGRGVAAKGERYLSSNAEYRKALRNLPVSSDLFRSRKEELVDRLGWSMEEIQSH